MAKGAQGLPKALSEAEIARLLGSVVGDDAVARRDRAILEMLYGTGMRISELVRLSLSDLAQVDEGVIRAFGKGSKERVVPVGRFARQALAHGSARAAGARWRRSGGPPGTTPRPCSSTSGAGGSPARARWLILRRYGDKVGLRDRLWPHVLRHSCATHMLDHGADIRVVQELLGHASIATTQVYTRVSAERLRQAYEDAHPGPASAEPYRLTPRAAVGWSRMTDLAPADLRAQLERERDDLRRQLAELGFGEGGGLDYDSNFADSSQVTAERGEAETLAASLKETLDEVEDALGQDRRRHLRHV